MPTFEEGRLLFEFGDESVSEYEKWSFYRNQFNSACCGNKAVDFICISGRKTWLIEVKDYRVNRREKAMDLADEVAIKVRDTLAGLVAAKFNANDAEERQTAGAVLGTRSLKVVLHLEQPRRPSKLFPMIVDPGKLLMKLKQKLKAIDPHPSIVDRHSIKPEMNWTVTGI